MNLGDKRLRIGLGLVVGFAATACGKQAPGSSPPVATAEPASSNEQEMRPGEVVHEYAGDEGGEGEADDDGEDEASADEGGDEAAGGAPADDGKLDAEELHALANAALDQALEPAAPRLVTPLLPTEWPSTSGKVMVLAYPMAPLESGITRYTLFAASHRVTIDVGDGTVATEPLGKPGKGKKLGSIEKTRERSDDPIHAAEQALVDVVAGRRPLEKSRMLLQPYTVWVEAHATVGKDVNARLKGFVDSLQIKPK
jgi:hypothetical protein